MEQTDIIGLLGSQLRYIDLLHVQFHLYSQRINDNDKNQFQTARNRVNFQFYIEIKTL